jgi:hypothetical protein
MYTTGIKKNPLVWPPGIEFLTPDSVRTHESCLTAQIRFMLFKGPGSFKKK